MILLGSSDDAFQTVAPRLNKSHLTEHLGYRPVPLFGSPVEGFLQCQTITQTSGRRYLKAVVVQSNLNARFIKEVSVAVCIEMNIYPQTTKSTTIIYTYLIQLLW